MNIKFISLFGALALIALVGGFALLDSRSEDSVLDLSDQATVNVVLTDHGFDPNHFRIKKGTEVVFSTTIGKQFWPASNIHPSHGLYPAFDPKRPLEPDEAWSFSFDNVGTWGLHDHLRSYYTGVIEVIE